jgi:uncharacterized protein YciI
MKILILYFILIGSCSVFAQHEGSTKQNKIFIYLLKLTPGYFDDNNWKEMDKQTVQVHFNRLQDMLSKGKLILAGRADVENEKTFGIVIFEADSFEEAVRIANEDPAVKAGIMSVEVFPFSLPLMKKE